MSDNIYYNPEKYGLTVVGEIEWSEPCYSFDTTVVWKDKDGIYYWASDSGCSCPSPFEELNSLDDVDGSGDRNAVIAFLQKDLDESDTYVAPQVVDLVARILSQ
jgi:hypothetical protein